MGTYMKAVAEVKCANGWVTIKNEIFPHPVPAWDKTSSSSNLREKVDTPFFWQDYGMYGLFAGVRNDSQTSVIATPRGIPKDIGEGTAEIAIGNHLPVISSGFYGEEEPNEPLHEQVRHAARFAEYHSFSWLTVQDLASFDYDAKFMDMRQTPPVEKTYRESLGHLYFEHLNVLARLGHPEAVRIVFWFNG